MRSIRDLFRYYFVDWHRRVDASWSGEMASGTFALLLVALAIFARKRPLQEDMIPWLVGFSFLAALQLGAAVIGNRRLRGFGAVAAVVTWGLLSAVLYQRNGFSIVHAGPVTMVILSVATCTAYYVSSKPPTKSSTA
jgi:hypothetical protein